MAYYQMEPWGRERESFAVLGSYFANAFRGEKDTPLEPHDILSDVPEREPEPPKSPEEIYAKFNRYAGAVAMKARSKFVHNR